MAQGVISTTLEKRFANYSIIRFGGSIHGALLGVVILLIVLTHFYHLVMKGIEKENILGVSMDKRGESSL